MFRCRRARGGRRHGLSIYPGFIDGGTDLGLNEPGVRNYDDVNEMLTFNQMLRTRVAYQSDSDAIPSRASRASRAPR